MTLQRIFCDLFIVLFLDFRDGLLASRTFHFVEQEVDHSVLALLVIVNDDLGWVV